MGKTNCRQEGKCFWHALAQIDFFFFLYSLHLIILSLGLRKLHFWPQTRAVIKQLSEFCVGGSGWQAQSGKWQTHQTAMKRSLLSGCLRLTHSFTWKGINLSDGGESVIETGRYVLNRQHRLHFNTIFYLWNKWPVYAFGVSSIEKLFGRLEKFVEM